METSVQTLPNLDPYRDFVARVRETLADIEHTLAADEADRQSGGAR